MCEIEINAPNFRKSLGELLMIFGLRDSHLHLSLRTNWIHMDPWSVQGIGLVSGDGQRMVLPKDLAVEQLQGSVHLVALANLDSQSPGFLLPFWIPYQPGVGFKGCLYTFPFLGLTVDSSGSVNICRHFRRFDFSL